MSKRILFFGNERLATGVTTAAPTFEALLADGYDIAALVVSQGDQGKSRRARQLEIVQLAEAKGIPVLTPERLKDAKDELKSFEAEAAVLVAYGKIVPKEVIDIFPGGIVNIHPSLLPNHRGSTPIESAILNGDKESGVSLMQLAPEMDAGPVYAQQKVALKGIETKPTLAATLSEIGARMVIQNLPAILDGSLKPKDQDEKEAVYDKQIDKIDGVIDWHKPATQVEREVRAYQGWPRSTTKLGTTDVIITKAHVGNASGTPGMIWLDQKQIGVYCEEDVLVIDSLIPTGKKEMSASAFLAGYTLG